MAGPVASSGGPSFPTLAFATSHGSDSYTLLLFALLVEPTDVARCTLGFDTHEPALPSVPRSQKRPVWCTGTGSRRLAQSPNLGISSVPLVADRVSLFSNSPILFQLRPSEDRPQEALAQLSLWGNLESEKEQNQVRTPFQKRRPGLPTVYGF